MDKHPTETAFYWRCLARAERAFAKEHCQTAESVILHRQNAKDADARADAIEAATARPTAAEGQGAS